jgi:hypothetical protein
VMEAILTVVVTASPTPLIAAVPSTPIDPEVLTDP